MIWSSFTKELQNAIKERGFVRPTSVQESGIPPIIQGKNTLLIATTGSGKTESVLLPVFDEFVKTREKNHLKPISILYVTPLKSLNRDLLRRINWWADKLDFEVTVRHGDTSQYERSMQVANPSDMFITTPETLQAMLVGPKIRNHLKNVRYAVIDEIHELVSNKRGIQLSVALERLKELAGRKIQLVGLSATIGSPEKVSEFLTAGEPCEIVNTVENKQIEISVESPKPTKEDTKTADKIYVGHETAARFSRIQDLVRKNKSVLIFTNTREFSEILSSRLKTMDKELPIETHHSSLAKNVRIDAEERFKQEKIKALVCTSSLELGIDIGSINLVLQYMSPRQVAKLLQRVGRSGHRITETSKGIIFATDSDDAFESSVIASLGKIEETNVYHKALDVLGHQIVGLSLEEYKIPAEKAFRIIRRAIPYRDMTRKEFDEVCYLMQKLRYIWVDTKYEEEPVLKRRKNAWKYYYFNMSTIPDVKNYRIYDVVTDKNVGTLDAEFIAMNGHPGTSFIVKGQAWRIVDIQEEKVLVEPEENIRAAIPAWEGELIPVPYDVAQGVGKLRTKVKNLKSRVYESLMKEYPIKREVAEKMVRTINMQKRFPVPDDRNILVEYFEDYVVIHTCFGSLVNETLGRVLSTLLTSKIGAVGLQTDPYRIMIKLPGFQYRHVLETFRNIKPEEIEPILTLTLPNTELFTWRFIQVCQRLGIIARNADYGKAYIRKIISVYEKTPPYREALNEVFQDKLDVAKAKDVMEKIRSGRIRIHYQEGLSKLGEYGLSRKYEIVAPEKPEGHIFKAFKDRLLDTKIGLVCCNCGDIFSSYSIRNIPEKIICRKCEAKLIGYAPYNYVKEASKLVKNFQQGKAMDKEEKKHFDSMLDTATLIMSSGKKATLALAGRGVGPKAASRILSKNPSSEDELLKLILEEEKRFARTKRFWKG